VPPPTKSEISRLNLECEHVSSHRSQTLTCLNSRTRAECIQGTHEKKFTMYKGANFLYKKGPVWPQMGGAWAVEKVMGF
jgi:hypothetical protein